MSVYRPSIDDDVIITDGNWESDSPAKDRFQKVDMLRVRTSMIHTYIQFFFCENTSGIPEAEIFGRKRKFLLFDLRFRPPNLRAEYVRKLNFKFFFYMDC